MPDTTPVALTVAIAELALLQTPPAVVFESVVVNPTQTDAVPVIVDTTGSALTVTNCVTLFTQPVVALVTV
jgi:hypothetical protein